MKARRITHPSYRSRTERADGNAVSGAVVSVIKFVDHDAEGVAQAVRILFMPPGLITPPPTAPFTIQLTLTRVALFATTQGGQSAERKAKQR